MLLNIEIQSINIALIDGPLCMGNQQFKIIIKCNYSKTNNNNSSQHIFIL